MTKDERVDPVQIFARVGGVTYRAMDASRAFEVWVHLARSAGWDVVELPADRKVDDPEDLGAVMVEGIKYRIHYSPRMRRLLADDSTGRLSYKDALGFAAWAEPTLSVD
ncbi:MULTISPECIES: hypothetical protein [Streptomyces]|uniref:Uncharacterized protein n=2 Tax=Streptomyces TaxID=1883 RepID=A0A1E7LG18_9ACTN|nr:hypothetical protein [Streptomyces nanshensis]OEV15165.1 hypothetical protein AN221_40190 [Streptomyces nanshensis]